jgi:tetratricopeptide (TPR) repeat protein
MSILRRTTLLISTACLLLVGLVACGSSTPVAPASQGDSTLAPAATDSLLRRAKTLIREATDKGSVDSLKQARALAERATGGSETTALAHYYVGLADFRMLNQFPNDAEDRRKQVLTDAIGHLKRATTIDATLADAWALLAGCYGQMMGMDPMKGMSLGPKSSTAMEKAKDLAPKNPRVWIISGTQDYFTPSMFGGDKERALKKFKKAARLAEQESVDDPLMPSWGHAEAYTWIGVAQMNAERYKKARTAFERALALNPDYGWVKHVLLPELEKKQS